MAHIMTEKEKQSIKRVTRFFRANHNSVVGSKSKGIAIDDLGFFCDENDIIQFTDGRLEHDLLTTMSNERHNEFLKQLKTQATVYDYDKPFDFDEWLGEQQPIKSDKRTSCQFYIEGNDMIIIGPWLKQKFLEYLSMREIPRDYECFGTDQGPITDIETLLEDLLLDEHGILDYHAFVRRISDGKNSQTPESHGELVVNALNNIENLEQLLNSQDAKRKSLFKDILDAAGLFSASTELYKFKGFKHRIIIEWNEEEEWDLRTNRTLLLLTMNQGLYRFISGGSTEVTGIAKDILFKELYENRICILRQREEDHSSPLAKQRRENPRAHYYSRAYYRVRHENQEEARDYFGIDTRSDKSRFLQR